MNLAHHNCFQVKNLKFLPPILLGHVFLKVGGYGSPMVPKQLIPGVIAGSGQCDRFCSKLSVLTGLPMMP
jgi:hypothetical protein